MMKTPSFDFLEENPTTSTECSNNEFVLEDNLKKMENTDRDTEAGNANETVYAADTKAKHGKSKYKAINMVVNGDCDNAVNVVGKTTKFGRKLFEIYLAKRKKTKEDSQQEYEGEEGLSFDNNGGDFAEILIKGRASKNARSNTNQNSASKVEYSEDNGNCERSGGSVLNLMGTFGNRYLEFDSVLFYSSLVLMLMLSIFICYADRIVMPSCIKSVGEEFGFDKSEQGLILGIFYGGYIWTQIIGGYVADTTKLGGKGVLFSGVFFWSLCMILTSALSYLGMIGFIICRIALGVGEGVSFPAVSSIIGQNISPKYSATVFSIIIASSYMGGGFSAFTTPLMIQKMGWRGPFYVLGLLGIIWSIVWLFFDVKNQKWSRVPCITGYCEKKNKDNEPKSSTADIEFCVASCSLSLTEVRRNKELNQCHAEAKLEPSSPEGNNKLTLKAIQRLFLNRNIFAIIVSQYCHGWTQYGFVTWMPVYYTDIHKIETSSLGYYTTPPWVLQAISIILFGYLSDISKSYLKPITVRKLFQFMSMFVGAACQLGLVALNRPGSSSLSQHYTLVVICLMFIFNAMSCGGVTVCQFDIAPEIPAVVYAIGNTFGTIAGLFSISLTGLILNKSENDINQGGVPSHINDAQLSLIKKWEIALIIYAFHNILGALIFIILGNDEDISIEDKKHEQIKN